MRLWTPRRRALSVYGLLAVLFIVLTILSQQLIRGARLDLTENHLYTLTQGSEHLLHDLREPITLSFYFSRQASSSEPEVRAYAGRVRELLSEIVARSPSAITLQELDPKPYSVEEDQATEAGLVSVPGERGDPLWFGLHLTNSTDGQASIDFFRSDREPFLEYDVIRLIHQLATPHRPVIGLITSLPMSAINGPSIGDRGERWTLLAELASTYDVKVIPATDNALPDGIAALFIIQPKTLTPALRAAIDRYLTSGGALLLCIDPDAHIAPPASADEVLVGSDQAGSFEPFLTAWGVQFDPAQTVGDWEHALRVGGSNPNQPARHLAFLGLNSESFDHSDAITSSLSVINLATPGHFQFKPTPSLRFTPLISTSRQAGILSHQQLALADSPEKLAAEFKITDQRYVLAARLEGLLPSALPTEAALDATHAQTTTRKPGQIILVADTDFLADPLWLRPSTTPESGPAEAWANNADFVLNALDNLTGMRDLMASRARPVHSRPFTRIEHLRAHADAQLLHDETALQEQLSITESKLIDLQAHRNDPTSLALSADQTHEIADFQQRRWQLRKQLRAVRHDLDERIHHLGSVLKALNVLTIPTLVAISGIGWLWRTRRRRKPPLRS